MKIMRLLRNKNIGSYLLYKSVDTNCMFSTILLKTHAKQSYQKYNHTIYLAILIIHVLQNITSYSHMEETELKTKMKEGRNQVKNIIS